MKASLRERYFYGSLVKRLCLGLDLPKIFERCATPGSLNICDIRPHFKVSRTLMKDVPIPQVSANDTPGTKNFLDIYFFRAAFELGRHE